MKQYRSLDDNHSVLSLTVNGVARAQLKRRKVGRSSAEGALVEAPMVPFLLFFLKIKHFGGVFKPDLTEETRTQLQEDEAITCSCLILATPVVPVILVQPCTKRTVTSGLHLLLMCYIWVLVSSTT